MISTLRALVISPDKDVLQRIQAAFRALPHIEVLLHTHVSEADGQSDNANVLILHSDSPTEWLRSLRTQGYTQPALVLTEDSENPRITPLEEDLLPLENVTWGVMRAGGLPHCVDMILSASI